MNASNTESLLFAVFILYTMGYESLQLKQIGFIEYVTDS